MTKLIIAGGRDFKDYDRLSKSVRRYYSREGLEIVSGGARGADRLGEDFAKEFNIPLTRFPADWNKHGKAAGYIRNKEMAEYGDALLAFWDGKSKGTRHMIDLAHSNDLHVIVKMYGEGYE